MGRDRGVLVRGELVSPSGTSNRRFREWLGPRDGVRSKYKLGRNRELVYIETVKPHWAFAKHSERSHLSSSFTVGRARGERWMGARRVEKGDCRSLQGVISVKLD
jgi:hypothetical protein